MVPLTRYARSGEASIAYQAIGDGPLDLLFLPGWISQVEHLWELPALRRYLDRLAAFSRVIVFDRRGGGLSDRVLGEYSLEQDAEDALAVLEAGKRAGEDPEELREAIQHQNVKDALRGANDEALALGVFGVPTVVVGERAFWGDDRLEEAAEARQHLDA